MLRASKHVRTSSSIRVYQRAVAIVRSLGVSASNPPADPPTRGRTPLGMTRLRAIRCRYWLVSRNTIERDGSQGAGSQGRGRRVLGGGAFVAGMLYTSGDARCAARARQGIIEAYLGLDQEHPRPDD